VLTLAAPAVLSTASLVAIPDGAAPPRTGTAPARHTHKGTQTHTQTHTSSSAHKAGLRGQVLCTPFSDTSVTLAPLTASLRKGAVASVHYCTVRYCNGTVLYCTVLYSTPRPCRCTNSSCARSTWGWLMTLSELRNGGPGQRHETVRDGQLHLPHDVQAVPEQQVVVAVDGTPKGVLNGSTARSTSHCSTA